MLKNFVFQNPTKVYFGKGQIENLPAELANYGKRVLLTYGGGSIKKTGLYDQIIGLLKDFEVYELSGIDPNPRISSVREGGKICKEKNIDVVLAVGGGSTIDCSKFICAAAKCDFDPWEFFSVRRPVEAALPLVTVLTLSATGSEMDSGAVLSNPDTLDKLGAASPLCFPKASFLDPTITYTVNAYQTACGSADIMSHIIETYFNSGDSYDMLDSFMEALMKMVVKYAPVAIKDPENYEARANLMWTSSWAINGFIKGGANVSWSCHPMEHELSAVYDITHGLGLAILTPRWMRYCKDETNLDRYVRFATEVFGVENTGNKEEVAEKGIQKMEEFLFTTLGLKSTLTAIGIDETHFDSMSYKAAKGTVIKGFKDLTPADVKNIYKMCL